AARRASMLYTLGLLLLVDLVRRLTSVAPLLEQQIFMLEALGVVALLGWALVRWGRRRKAVTPGKWDRTLRIATFGTLALFCVAVFAGLTGYVRLAFFIGSGVIGSVYVALVIYAGARVAGALVAVGLSSWPLANLRIVQGHRPLVERRVRTFLACLAVLGWALLALRRFGLLSSAVAVADPAGAAGPPAG